MIYSCFEISLWQCRTIADLQVLVLLKFSRSNRSQSIGMTAY
ncbi:hypothetical protein [Chamaesiphon polymorphus]|nr:hypothetical protein [Chamaesiphon polymorphus]